MIENPLGASGEREGRRVPRKPRRRGSLYVAVLGATMIVGMIALASATVGRLKLREVVSQGDQREAEWLAQSGVEYSFNLLMNDSGWRDGYTSGDESSPISLGNGTFAWSVTDTDGDLGDSEEDPFTLRGIGRVGDATAVQEVTVSNDGPAFSALAAAVHTDDSIDLQGSVLTTNQEASSNNEIKFSSGAGIEGDAWSTGTVEDHAAVSGTVSENQSPARDLPSDSVFDYYASRGSVINIDDLPEDGGDPQLGYMLLSPAENKYGETNPEGIYVIDCQDEDLIILRLRIVGTLVLLNAGDDTRIEGVVHMAPAIANYPTLLVQGDMNFDMLGFLDADIVTEATALTNLNPPSTPYQGQSDEDLYDTYPSRVEGLVYVSGTMTVTQRSVFDGVVIGADALYLEDDATFNYRSTFYNNPPPGFKGAGSLRISPGSWRRAAY